MAKSKTFVYIDCENFKGSVVACGYNSVDYNKLYSWLRTIKKVDRIYLYASYLESDNTAITELDSLEKLGFIVRRKQIMQYRPEFKTHNLKCSKCGDKAPHVIKRNGRSKGNCDSELTLDVINDVVRGKYSKLVVFSGDGDFTRMYDYISDTLNKEVLIYSPKSGEAKFRTSLAIKTMDKNGKLRLEDLRGILVNFANK